MSRRRYRASPAATVSPGFSIGVTLTPIGASAANAGGTGAITGPIIIGGQAGGGYQCTWLVMMRGVSANDEIEWVAEWDGMDGDYAGSVTFGVSDEDASQPMVAQVVNSASGALDWIDISAIVNGTTYGPERVSCLV